MPSPALNVMLCAIALITFCSCSRSEPAPSAPTAALRAPVEWPGGLTVETPGEGCDPGNSLVFFDVPPGYYPKDIIQLKDGRLLSVGIAEGRPVVAVGLPGEVPTRRTSDLPPGQGLTSWSLNGVAQLHDGTLFAVGSEATDQDPAWRYARFFTIDPTNFEVTGRCKWTRPSSWYDVVAHPLGGFVTVGELHVYKHDGDLAQRRWAARGTGQTFDCPDPSASTHLTRWERNWGISGRNFGVELSDEGSALVAGEMYLDTAEEAGILAASWERLDPDGRRSKGSGHVYQSVKVNGSHWSHQVWKLVRAQGATLTVGRVREDIGDGGSEQRFEDGLAFFTGDAGNFLAQTYRLGGPDDDTLFTATTAGSAWMAGGFATVEGRQMPWVVSWTSPTADPVQVAWDLGEQAEIWASTRLSDGRAVMAGVVRDAEKSRGFWALVDSSGRLCDAP